jgi:hypothetical protein
MIDSVQFLSWFANNEKGFGRQSDLNATAMNNNSNNNATL